MVRRDARSQNPAGPWQRRSGETQGNGCGEGSPKLRWTLNDETRNSESPPNYGANQPDATRCAREGLGRRLKVQWQERPTLAERRGEKALTSTHRWASANARAQSASASSIPSRIRGRERWWVRRPTPEVQSSHASARYTHPHFTVKPRPGPDSSGLIAHGAHVQLIAHLPTLLFPRPLGVTCHGDFLSSPHHT